MRKLTLLCYSHSSGPFYATTLTTYLASFDFGSDPLDIALRKFLMEASLPTETQQIDRVMEAFAIRYNECNPGLFVSSDTPYVLAFSLVMLSTDQFNPSNKNKMSRGDYVRNTKIDGVPIEVLEVNNVVSEPTKRRADPPPSAIQYLFDQITLHPFVFVEDQNEFGTARPEMYASTGSFFSKSSSSSGMKSKLDPYHLIAMVRGFALSTPSGVTLTSCSNCRALFAIFGLTLKPPSRFGAPSPSLVLHHSL